MAAKMSNAEWTRNLVQKNPKQNPAWFVDRIVAHTGMEKSGARTYLANARKALAGGKAKKMAAKKRKAPAKTAKKRAVKKAPASTATEPSAS